MQLFYYYYYSLSIYWLVKNYVFLFCIHIKRYQLIKNTLKKNIKTKYKDLNAVLITRMHTIRKLFVLAPMLLKKNKDHVWSQLNMFCCWCDCILVYINQALPGFSSTSIPGYIRVPCSFFYINEPATVSYSA